MAELTMEVWFKIKEKVLVLINGKMVDNIEESGKMENKMESDILKMELMV